jgi:periplasmic protein TonB
MASQLQEASSSTPYTSGIYSHLGSEPKDPFGPLSLVPGVPHIIANKLKTKGYLLLGSFVLATFCLLLLVLPKLSYVLEQLLVLTRNQNAADIANIFNFPFWFRLTFGTLLSGLIAFLVFENKRDVANNFNNLEADRKPALFAAAMSGSYLASTSTFLTILIYGLFFHFIPIKKDHSIEIEMVSPFVDNPIQKKEPKEPPKDAKHVAVQNAVNSGRHMKNMPLSPGMSQPVPKPQNSQVSKPAQQSQPKQAPSPRQVQRPAQQPSPPSPPTPVALPKPKSMGERPLLPIFKPKASDEKSILSSNDSTPTPAQPVSPGNSGSSANRAAVASASSYSGPSGRGPVLPSRQGGFSSGAGLGNAGPNNNPNGPATVAARKDVDYGPFMQDLQRRIQQSWKPASADKADQVVLSFTLRKDGSLVPGSISTVKASGAESEAAARQAVIAASPGFRPLPSGAADQVRIDFTFTRTGTKFMGLKKY